MTSSPIASSQIASTPGCWESFTSTVSSGMQAVAAGVSSLFAMVKNAFARMYASIAPAFNNMIGWMKANPQAAIVAAGVTAAASLGALYYCFCKGEKAADPAKAGDKAAEVAKAGDKPADKAAEKTATPVKVKVATN